MGELLILAALAAAGVLFLLWLARLARRPTPLPQGPPAQPWHRVTRVRDGDTLEVDMDGVTVPVRVLGIDTPETVHPDKPVEHYGPEASAEAHRLLDGQWVQITMDLLRRQHVDAYGRLVAYVTLPDGWDYGWLMLVNGYARENTFAGQRYERRPGYLHAETLARAASVGMWATARHY